MKIDHLKKNYLHRNELATIKINLRQSVVNLLNQSINVIQIYTVHIITNSNHLKSFHNIV